MYNLCGGQSGNLYQNLKCPYSLTQQLDPIIPFLGIVPKHILKYTQKCSRLGADPAWQLAQPPHHPSPIPDSLPPWQRVFFGGIIGTSFSLFQKRTHFAHRSPPDLVCPVWVSPADLKGERPFSTSRWQNSYSSGLQCPEGWSLMSFTLSSLPLSPPTIFKRGKGLEFIAPGSEKG